MYESLISKLSRKFHDEYNKENNKENKKENEIQEIQELLIDIYNKIKPNDQQSNQSGGAKRNYRRKLSRKTKLAKTKKTVKTKSCTVSAKS